MTSRKNRLAFFLVLLPLAGCALWSDFEPPETPKPEAWKGQGGEAGVDSTPDADWWKSFNSPVLTGMVEEASQSNFDLNAAVARMKQADAQARIAGAPLLPNVSAGGSVGRSRALSTSVTNAGQPVVSNAYVGTISASYELDFWGKNYATAQAAQSLAVASRFDKETVALTVSSAVADNYFDIIATKERLLIAENNAGSAERLLEAIKNRFDAGTSSGLDVAQQENLLATERAKIPPLTQHLQQALDAQAILLGKLPENMTLPDEKLAAIALPEVAPGLPSKLLERRPDVQSAEAQLAATHANIIAARADFFPNIGLTASTGYESAALAALFKPGSMVFSLTGSATQVLFDNGQLVGELDVAKAQYEESLQNYRKAAFSAFSDVEDALAAAKQAEESEKDQQEAEQSAHKAYDLSKQQMDNGIVDITVLLNTQRAWYDAQDALLQARFTHLQALVGLYKALGGGWEIAPTPADAGVMS